MKSKGLGRGLSALMGENLVTEEINKNGLSEILIENITPNPKQPRVVFSSTELEELEGSIKQNGVLQPILIKPIDENKYQIIAGERRWRASKMLGLATIPAIIKDISDTETLELALIENIQRENLSPLEEAESYKRLIEEHQYTQERMSAIVNKSRSHIANLLRLLSLPEKIKNYLNDGLISLGHAKLLINNKESESLIDIIVNNSLNVRESEDLLKRKDISSNNTKKTNNTSKKTESIQKDEDLIALEEFISEALGMVVEIAPNNNGGKLSIYFEDFEELDSISKKLTNSIA